MKKLVIPLIAAALVLAGCTAPVATPTPDSTPTSTAAPTDAPFAGPVLRVTTPCSDLANTATLAGWFEIAATEDENSPLDILERAAVRTTGALHCRWGSGYDPEYGFELSWFDLIVRPASDVYDYEDEAQNYIDAQYTDFDTAGDRSVLSCTEYGDTWGCRGEMKVDGYWVSAGLSVPQQSPRVGDTAARHNMQNAMQKAAAALRGISPVGEAWVRPADAATGAGLCGNDRKPAIKIMSQAWGVKNVQVSGGDAFYTDLGTYHQSDSKECTFATPEGYLYFVVLPGGAWWGDLWDTNPPTDYRGHEFSAIDVPGADRAVGGCSSGLCTAYVVADGSVVAVSGQGFTKDEFIAGLRGVKDLLAL